MGFGGSWWGHFNRLGRWSPVRWRYDPRLLGLATVTQVVSWKCCRSSGDRMPGNGELSRRRVDSSVSATIKVRICSHGCLSNSRHSALAGQFSPRSSRHLSRLRCGISKKERSASIFCAINRWDRSRIRFRRVFGSSRRSYGSRAVAGRPDLPEERCLSIWGMPYHPRGFRRRLLFPRVLSTNKRNAMAATPNAIAVGIQMGAKTHNHDHEMTPASFNPMNSIASMPKKPMPPPVDTLVLPRI